MSADVSRFVGWRVDYASLSACLPGHLIANRIGSKAVWVNVKTLELS